MSATADARGLKRACTPCGIRFYDFNKRPVRCPNCQAEFSGEIKLKARRGRVPGAAELEEAAKAKAKAALAAANDDDTIEAREDGVVSLEDVEVLENAADEDEENVGLGEEEEDIDPLVDIAEEDIETGAGKKKK